MDDLAKQIAELNRNIEKLIGLLLPPSAIGGGGLHVYVHQVPPITDYGQVSRPGAPDCIRDPRYPTATMRGLADIDTNVQIY